jgi:hypothetical protein
MRSSSSKVITAGYVSPLVAIRRAGDVATNTATLCTASSLADKLIKLRRLSEPLCYLTD